MDTTTDFAVDLLVHYIFDLAGHTPSELIDRWLKDYPATWVHLAVVESLYQGRYKAVSVEQILAFWKRRGQALYHFNHDFERLVCSNFPDLTSQAQTNASFPLPLSEKSLGSSNGDRPSDAVVVATEIQVVDTTTASTSSSGQLIQRCHHTANVSQEPPLKSDNPCPIEQFIPDTAYSSDFYTKLKAIAQSPD